MMKKTKLRYILYFFNYSQLKMSKTLWTRCIMINSMQKVNTNQSNLIYLSIHCLERIFFIMFFLTIEESFLRWLNFSSKILQAWFQTFILPKLRRKEKKKLSHVFKIYLYIIQPFSYYISDFACSKWVWPAASSSGLATLPPRCDD